MKYQCEKCGTSLGFQGLCWKCRAEQERQAVLSWSEEEIQEKLKNIIVNVEKLGSYKEQEHQDFWNLLTCFGIASPEVARAALMAKVYYPGEIYYHAPADVGEGLIDALLYTENPHEAGHLMSCLAMQGDENALKTLLELEQNPRPWRKSLYVDPSSYAQGGNWSFDSAGQRMPLGYDICYPMVKGDKAVDSAAVIGGIREENCPHCGCKMVDMLSLDGRDLRFAFLGIDGIITATCCPNCVAFTEAAYSRFTLDGGSEAIAFEKGMVEDMEDYVGEDGVQELSSNPFVLGKTPVPLFYGAYNEDVNTIGGFANWVQDWLYTPCPDCGKPMHFLAQIHWDTVMNCSEGTLYIEICPECHVASMHHQQT